MVVGLGVAVQERYHRMGGGVESAQLAARRVAQQAEVYSPMQFTPQLNPRSQALAPAGSGGVAALSELAEKQRQKLAELREAEEERQRSLCTFQVCPCEEGLLCTTRG